MKRSLDLPRPPPVRASLTPIGRRLQEAVADVAERSLPYATALEVWIEMIRVDLDQQDRRAGKTPRRARR